MSSENLNAAMTAPNLCFPPPVTGVHVMVHAVLPVVVSILTLRLQNQAVNKVGILPERADTFQNITRMEFKDFALHNNLMTGEPRP
jgi:hypothetical protein